MYFNGLYRRHQVLGTPFNAAAYIDPFGLPDAAFVEQQDGYILDRKISGI
jgi:hypothetical protein